MPLCRIMIGVLGGDIWWLASPLYPKYIGLVDATVDYKTLCRLCSSLRRAQPVTPYTLLDHSQISQSP
jgi:hypothetical protein